MGAVKKRLRWVAVGVLTEFFLDPVAGRGRRATASRAFTVTKEHAARLVERSREIMPAPLAGHLDRLSTVLIRRDRPDDRALAERVRREALEPAEASHLVVRAHDGHVAVDGARTSAAFATELEDRIRRVPGVLDVALVAQRPGES